MTGYEGLGSYVGIVGGAGVALTTKGVLGGNIR